MISEDNTDLCEKGSKVGNSGSMGLKGVAAWTLIVNLALAIIKLTAGIAGRSQALVADALHTFSDSVTDLAVLIGAFFWERPPDSGHPYGHRRIETLVAIGMGFSLTAAAFGMGWSAIQTLLTPGVRTPPGGIALWTALLSILVKEGLYHWSRHAGRRLRSLSLQANAWHHRSDAFSSIPVALAIIGARLMPNFGYLDALGALVVALLVLEAAVRILRGGMSEIIESGAPRHVQRDIAALVASVKGVRDLHQLRSRYVGARLYVDLHVLVDPSLTVRAGHEIATQVSRRVLDQAAGVVDVVVHIEPDDS